MGTSKLKLHCIGGILFIIGGMVAMALAILITPAIFITLLSSHHTLTLGIVNYLDRYKFVLAVVGLFLLISGSILLAVRDLKIKLQRIVPLFHPGPRQLVLFGIFSTILLFVGFFMNFWQVAKKNWFQGNATMDSFVVGRMVQSAQNGIFSYGGLLGNGSPDAGPAKFENAVFVYQYSAYSNDLTFASFTPYQSLIGGQGMIFSVLDGWIRLASQEKLQIFYAISALLSALALSMIILWFYSEFGFLASLFVLVSAVLSPWLVVFGGKLYWAFWSFFLPMLAIMYYLKKKNTARHININLGILVFITVFMKCFLTGYEYITTTLVMMMVPFVFYYFLRGLSIRNFISGSLTAIFSSCLAILLSFTILCIQIGSFEGSFSKGIDHIVYSWEVRTYADPQNFGSGYTASLKAHTLDVVMTYLNGSYFGIHKYLPTYPTFDPIISILVPWVRYGYLIILFAVVSILLHAIGKRYSNKEKHKSNLALILATWFSILAPLSWFVIFKSHSYMHTSLNYVTWEMPFTLFGFALCGRLLQAAFTGGSHAALASPENN